MIITKSLSRFARNTVDCLETVRMLKSRNIGVLFEKENINTLTESSEFLITLHSSFAQAESESISKNVAWGKRKSMEAGNVPIQYSKLLGYRKGPDCLPEIVPEYRLVDSAEDFRTACQALSSWPGRLSMPCGRMMAVHLWRCRGMKSPTRNWRKLPQRR